MSIRKIIRQIIKESLIKEVDDQEKASFSNLDPSSFSFKISSGPLLGYSFSQEQRETPADYAIQEKNEWNGMHDNDPECVDLLKKYWGDFYGQNNQYWIDHNSENPNMHFCERHPVGPRVTYHPWSAAFVRWCMRQAGRDEFNSINHIPFFIDAYKNRFDFLKDHKSLGEGKYMLFFTNEIEEDDIVKGDNGIFFRDGTNQTPTAAMGFFERNRNNARSVIVDTHSDICIGGGKCIGGNVGEPGTVGERDISNRWVAVAKFVNGYEYAPEIYATSDSYSDYPESKV